MAWCIVNSPPDRNNHEKQVSLTSTNIFNRFKKQSSASREFKKGYAQVGFWGIPSHHPQLSDQPTQPVINPANINNLIHTSSDHLDVNAALSDFPVGSANGYIFPKPAKITQGFKSFGIKFGRFGHLYGTGAFYSHREYPHEIRWGIKLDWRKKLICVF